MKTRIKKSFDKLSASLQAKLSDAKEFAKATLDELRSVPQDLLSSLEVNVFYVLCFLHIKPEDKKS